MERTHYDHFLGLYKYMPNVVFIIDAEMTENSDNCTVELRNNIQQILDETNEFENITLDEIMNELKQNFYALSKENKESYIIDILQKWVEFEPYFDIRDERQYYWIDGMTVDTYTDFYNIAKQVIRKSENILAFLKATIFEKYLSLCYKKKQQFFKLLSAYCYLIDIDFSLLQEKVATPPQTTKTKDYSALLKDLSVYIEKIKIDEFNNIINNHSFTLGTPKANWIGEKVAACYFCDHLKMSHKAWNKLFCFPDGRKLHGKHKDKLDKGSPIIAILKTHIDK